MKSNPYVAGLIAESERNLSRGIRTVYRINDKISNSEASSARAFFNEEPLYMIEMRKCQSCNGTWDVVLTYVGLGNLGDKNG